MYYNVFNKILSRKRLSEDVENKNYEQLLDKSVLYEE